MKTERNFNTKGNEGLDVLLLRPSSVQAMPLPGTQDSPNFILTTFIYSTKHSTCIILPADLDYVPLPRANLYFSTCPYFCMYKSDLSLNALKCHLFH